MTQTPDEEQVDQDAEPTQNAPAEARPDGTKPSERDDDTTDDPVIGEPPD